MRRTILAAVLALAACGPALPPPHPLGASGSDPDEKVVCQDERTTGTNMSRSVCLTHDQIEENRRAAEEWEKHPRNSVTNSK
jgi:hypothetical protein